MEKFIVALNTPRVYMNWEESEDVAEVCEAQQEQEQNLLNLLTDSAFNKKENLFHYFKIPNNCNECKETNNILIEDGEQDFYCRKCWENFEEDHENIPTSNFGTITFKLLLVFTEICTKIVNFLAKEHNIISQCLYAISQESKKNI